MHSNNICTAISISFKLIGYVGKGPTDPSNIVCVSCQGNSEGRYCENCKDGYFEKNSKCEMCVFEYFISSQILLSD